MAFFYLWSIAEVFFFHGGYSRSVKEDAPECEPVWPHTVFSHTHHLPTRLLTNQEREHKLWLEFTTANRKGTAEERTKE